MYRAKGTRSGWALYDPLLDRERSERLALLVDLREALSGDALVLHFQPLVDLRTGEVDQPPAKRSVRTHRVEVIDGVIFVELSSDAPNLPPGVTLGDHS